jgi:hypothetical protein
MSARDDRPETDGRRRDANGGESGKIRAKSLRVFFARGSYPNVMEPSPWRLLALVVVLVGFVAAPLTAAGDASVQPRAATNASDGETTDPGPGAHLAGVVAVQDTEVRNTVASETFRARLANASSDGERAALVAQRLDATERRLAALEARLETLERTRASMHADRYTARVAAVASNASDLVAVATETAQAAERLPAEDRSTLAVSERVERIRTRAGTLRDQTSGATDAIEGAGEPTRARPFSLADIEDFAGRVGTPSTFQGISGSERINAHVRRANGSTAAFAVRIEDGRVTTVDDEAFDDPTLAVYTDYRVVRQVQRAEDPVEAVRTALEADRIRYDGRGIGNSLKYGAIKLASMLAGALLWLVPLLRP